MTNLNVLQKALIEKGLAQEPKQKRKRFKKKFSCHKCGEPMIRIEDTNVMVCSKCSNYFIFSKNGGFND